MEIMLQTFMLVHIGDLYFVEEAKLFISMDLVFSMLLKKLNNLLCIIISKKKTFRTKSNNFIIYGYFSIGLIDFMLAGKKLTDFYQFFCPHDFEKNDSIIMSYFKDD